MPVNIGSTEASMFYAGSSPLSALYVGATKVWPSFPPVVYVEDFNRNMDDGWTNFVAEGDKYPNARVFNSTACTEPWSNAKIIVQGRYSQGALGTDSHFCDVLLGPAQGTATLAGSGELLSISLRRSGVYNVGTAVVFSIRPDGSRCTIGIQTDGVYRLIAEVYKNSVGVGSLMRFVTLDDGFCAIYEWDRSTTPIVSWTDNARELVYGNPSHRHMTMTQENNAEALANYVCHSVNELWYGDYDLAPAFAGAEDPDNSDL